jgi:hypothetical protein
MVSVGVLSNFQGKFITLDLTGCWREFQQQQQQQQIKFYIYF